MFIVDLRTTNNSEKMKKNHPEIPLRSIKKILIADAIEKNAIPSINKLKKTGLEVFFADNADCVLFMLENESICDVANIQAVILQHELPHKNKGGALSPLVTNNGQETGTALYWRIRFGSLSTPVIIYTRRKDVLKKLKTIKDPKLLILDTEVFFTERTVEEITSFLKKT